MGEMFAVLIAFAGALVAAVGTGMLLGRCIRTPRIDLGAWSAAMAMLAVSLGAQTLGFALGFSGATYRAAELGAMLLGPLWLAWGLVELTSDNMATRFGIRLATGALTIVPGVILALDPMNTRQFGKAWPGQAPYMALPHDVLLVVQLTATVTALAVMTVTALRTRTDPSLFDLFIAVAAIGIAVLLLISLRAPLHVDAAHPVLTAAAAGLVWFAVTRAEPSTAGQRAGGGRRRAADPAGGSRPGRRRRAADWEPGRYDDDETGPLRALAARAAGPPGSAPGRRRAGGSRRRAGAFPGPGDDEDWPGEGQDRAGSAREPGRPGLDAASIAPGLTRGADEPASGRLYGLIAIFTLLDSRAQAFDRLAEETVHAVRMHEPRTLIYIAHHVPNAPMQRIFYEVYRDRAAYDYHQRQPHIERFLAQRRPSVLATNVIELNLRHAKVSSLPAPSEMTGMQVTDGAG